jgi:hypothetical protein
MIKKRFLNSFVMVFLCFSIFACAPTRSVRIQDKFEPLYRPNFDYNLTAEKQEPSGYTIGIIQANFIEKNEQGWRFIDPQEKQYLDEFKRGISYGLEKILLAKGNKVSGPFASYEEMTYPERDRCSYLIQPTVILDLTLQRPIFNRLRDVGGPNLEAYVYSSGTSVITGKAEMEYIILEPLTQDKLERHKLKTKEISISFEELAQAMLDKEGNIKQWYPLYEIAGMYPDLKSVYSNDYARLNASGKILEELLQSFLSEADKLISVEEFKYLEKYKRQLKEKKRY